MYEQAGTQWWYDGGGGQAVGPVSTDEVRELVRSGRLAPTSAVIPEGGAAWRPVSELSGELGLGGGVATAAPPGPAPVQAAPAPAPVAAPAPAPAPQDAAPNTIPLSSAGKRIGAYFLDAVLAAVTLGIGWLIWSIIVWGKGQSPAKSLLGMRVAMPETGRAATRGQMALRELIFKGLLGSVTGGILTIVSGFMIFGESRQAVWDKLSKSVVVEDPDGRLLGL